VAVRESNPKYTGYPSVVEVAANPEKYTPMYGIDPTMDNSARIDEPVEVL
jgi:hypothetical protein